MSRISISRSKFLPTEDLSRIAIIGDPQNYASYPEYAASLTAQIQWILDNRISRKIELVLCTGDMVNSPVSTTEYTRAYGYFSPLIGVVPLVICSGNHDGTWGDTANFNAVGSSVGYGFGDLRSHMTGLKDANKLENGYRLLSLSGRQHLILSLEYAPRDAVVSWAGSVLAEHPRVPTILLTHAFMFRDGTIYDATSKLWDPKFMNPNAPDINTGTDIVSKLIEPYPQVKIIVSGHAFSGHSHGTWIRSDGSKYHGIQQDYQQYDSGALDPRGFMYEVTAKFVNDAITGCAFSPMPLVFNPPPGWSPVEPEWPETLSSENPQYANVYIANAGIR